MKTIFVVVIFLAIGAGVIWYFTDQQRSSDAHAAMDKIEASSQSAEKTLEDQFRNLHLDTNDIKDELARTGRVIREKAQSVGHEVADAATDARITGTIKAKLVASRHLSPFKISVKAEHGVVTLGGTVETTDDVSRAMVMAMDTDGVVKVISALKVPGM